MPPKPPAANTKPAPPKPGTSLPKPPSKPGTPSPGKAKREVKSFSVAPLSGNDEGEKMLIYGQSGLGKTTLAAQIPNAVFIPIDDGARKIYNPLTNQPVNAIHGVEDWDDLRDAVHQAPNLIEKGGALVIDTLTRCQNLAEDWVVENVPLEKGGKAKNFEAFGFGKGFRHELDQFRLLLSDCDALIRSGRHVILLCQLAQENVANAGGVDYISDVPKLNENKQGPIRTEVCEWCDHVVRIGFLDLDVVKDHDHARAGKSKGDDTRALFTGGAQHFLGKSRPINGHRLPPVIGFEHEADNSLWQFALEGATAGEGG